MLLSKCAMCDSKKSKFIKQQEYSGLLSKLRIKYQSKDLHNDNFYHKWFIKTMTCLM